jgi:hypothetical protein
MEYNIPIAEINEKKPTEPEVQTAEKTDVQEALEVLLEGSIKKKKATLKEQASAFRKRLDAIEEMEAKK